MDPVTNNFTCSDSSVLQEHRCKNLYNNFEQRVACATAARVNNLTAVINC